MLFHIKTTLNVCLAVIRQNGELKAEKVKNSTFGTIEFFWEVNYNKIKQNDEKQTKFQEKTTFYQHFINKNYTKRR